MEASRAPTHRPGGVDDLACAPAYCATQQAVLGSLFACMLGLRPYVRPDRDGQRVHLQHAVGAGPTRVTTVPDPSSAPRQPEPGQKQVRTAWRLRHRYRLARRLATLAGAALALALVAI